MSADVQNALRAAQEAHAAATVALAAAEQAARAAGVRVEAAELTVERIRVVEADGTLRLLIGNSSVTDATPMRGVDEKHPGRQGAGLIFVNDEGTECGGLVCAGEDGRQMVRMSFDSYEQNDAAMFGHVDQPEGRCSFVELVDRPRWSVVDYLREVAEAPTDDGKRSATAGSQTAPGTGVCGSRRRPTVRRAWCCAMEPAGIGSGSRSRTTGWLRSR